MTQQQGQIVTAFGRQFVVESADAVRHICTTRGKKTEYACGDRVLYQVLNAEQGVINTLEPRRNLLFRQDAFRQKLLAANVDQIILVVAAWPPPSLEFVSRAIIAADAADIPLVLLQNKTDLPDTEALQDLLALVDFLNVPRLAVSALADVEVLSPHLSGRLTLLMGQSGMGKSTLLNALLPGAAARVGEVSNALQAGTHTTTHAAVYTLDHGGQLIDAPGFQEFGLYHLALTELASCFREFRPYLGECRFANCRHLQEPDCQIRAAGQQGQIPASRLSLYQRLMTTAGAR